uniref:Uncharacterized protein n=1 Tax=Anguilla anguilla TaxID=7936 RepID=A0A0E9PCI4_ANGAN
MIERILFSTHKYTRALLNTRS